MSDAKRPVAGEVRLETAMREQLELVPTNIEELIAADHPARAISEREKKSPRTRLRRPRMDF
ncbi:MAG: hypothetical protein K8T20_19130 [Planctomycetes bacterium]|nr:hypothetical protein [Planctomycetota bacterium]